MTPLYTIEGPLEGQGPVCDRILHALPDWFGIEAALVAYTKAVETLPTLVASVGEHTAGFLTLKIHTSYAAELYVMGVLRRYHRQGIGRALVERAEEVLYNQGIEYFQVKTLAPSHPDPGYGGTRRFYEAIGFRPLEIFPELWGPENPCLLMIKCIGNRI